MIKKKKEEPKQPIVTHQYQCDHCDNPATVNVECMYHKYSIDNDGNFEQEDEWEGNDSQFYCEDCWDANN